MNLKKNKVIINEEDGGGDSGGGESSSGDNMIDISTGISTASFAGWSTPASGRGFDMPREAAERIKKARKKGNKFTINTPTGFTFDDYIGFAVKNIKKDPNNT